MTKKIRSLEEDIYHILNNEVDHDPSDDLAAEYAMRIGGEFAKSLIPRNKPREIGRYWASDLGKSCGRRLWYDFNDPEKGEGLMGHTKFKFLYGNILEEAVLYMAEEAGHDVSMQQREVEFIHEDVDPHYNYSVRGRIDAMIDGHLVDVKTTSSYGCKKYKDGITHSNDDFGYLWQLGFYASHIEADGTGFVFIDKQNGHIKYVECIVPTPADVKERAEWVDSTVRTETVDEIQRPFSDKVYGKSGNMVLDTTCSYCPYKRDCWKDANNGAGLKGYAYNHGPVWMTEVKRTPNVPELTDA